jgi:hypothetical protein
MMLIEGPPGWWNKEAETPIVPRPPTPWTHDAETQTAHEKRQTASWKLMYEMIII